MEISKLSINGAWKTYSPIIRDSRGYLKEWFNESVYLDEIGLPFNVEQSLSTMSHKGVIRGIHYSVNPISKWKWISCLNGSILDVIVDIRPNSPSFGRYETIELNHSNGMGILIQGNLGHGFQSLEENSVVVYNLSAAYVPNFEKGLNPLDTDINIRWPLQGAIISEKDATSPSLKNAAKNQELPELR